MKAGWLQSNLMLRIVSSAVLIPVVLFAVISGGFAFKLLVVVALGLSAYEWVGIVRRLPSAQMPLCLLMGCIYFAAAIYSFFMIRMLEPHGLYMTVCLMLVIWASDTGGYVAGKLIGGPKMSPTISPKKTWAGYAGAVVAPAAAFLILIKNADFFAVYFVNEVQAAHNSVWLLIIFGALFGVVGQSGDLLMSYMKRKVGIKDSGNVIPGHGGILDRIDALLLVAPVFLCFEMFLLK